MINKPTEITQRMETQNINVETFLIASYCKIKISDAKDIRDKFLYNTSLFTFGQSPEDFIILFMVTSCRYILW